MAFRLVEESRRSIDDVTGIEFLWKGRGDAGVASFALHDPSSTIKTRLGVGYFWILVKLVSHVEEEVKDGKAVRTNVILDHGEINRNFTNETLSEYIVEKELSWENLETIIKDGLSLLVFQGLPCAGPLNFV